MRRPFAAFLLPFLFAFACGESTSSGPPLSMGCVAVSGCSNSDTTAGGADGGTGNGDDDSAGDDSPGDDTTGDKPARPSMVDTTNETVSAGGVERKYLLAVPKNYDAAKSYPLVFVFHGDGGDGPSLYGTFPLDVGSGSDAILVYPSGLGAEGKGGDWDEGGPIDNNVDFPILDGIRDAVKAKYTIADGKVFGVGYSKGAFFASRAGCVKTDFFRAIVAIAGGQVQFDPNGSEPGMYGTGTVAGPSCLQCPGHPSVMYVHGTEDNTVLFQAGTYGSQCWAANNRCEGVFDGRDATGPASCETYKQCADGQQVLFCPIQGANHGNLFSQTDFVMTTQVWNFLKTFL